MKASGRSVCCDFPSSLTITVWAAALTGRRDIAQLRHDLLGEEPHRFSHPSARNPAAPIELQDALIHRGKLLLEALQALYARRRFVVDTDLLGLRKVPGHPAHGTGRKIRLGSIETQALHERNAIGRVGVTPVLAGHGMGFSARLELPRYRAH